ncbi:Protein kinase domain [Macleaya cordata]|uniref:Protein kinase domain n=1 Tax=Macleaya cordata TaxID=56857 RepID=A0A200Q3B8_MACCD|nr:Protein kinase domain [Macleaya cordata]
MNRNNLFLITITILTLVEVVLSVDQRFEACKPRNCGNGPIISYPFWIQEEYCGYPEFRVICRNNESILNVSGNDYIIRDISYTNQSFRVVNSVVLDANCPAPLQNSTFDDQSPFKVGSNVQYLSFFYNCTNLLSEEYNNLTYPVNTCATSSELFSFAMFVPPVYLSSINDHATMCQSLSRVPVEVDKRSSVETREEEDYTLLLKNGFTLEWDKRRCNDCQDSGGNCGFDKEDLVCFCVDGPHKEHCVIARNLCEVVSLNHFVLRQSLPNLLLNSGIRLGLGPRKANAKRKVALGNKGSTQLETFHINNVVVVAVMVRWWYDVDDDNDNGGGAGATVGGAIFALSVFMLIRCLRKKSSSNNSVSARFWKETNKNDHPNVEAFFRNYGSLAPKRFRYVHVKKMTNSFKEKLGQGGYGSVFKGQLHDGRLVAVKVLFNKSRTNNGEEFLNEVASISRTSHVNIVSLLGFCFEGKKRALIYEFMPNGSLDKFIYGEKLLLESDLTLGWETLYQVAVGIARGLEYLHHGCNTRILHFDIKPYNILLDENFCPKISDFGLAKLCPGKESIISMLGERGTAGYIAPEVFSRNFGGVSHKSDVYSYGMMVLEMVGGRKNIDVKVGIDHSSQLYFPHWIYDRLKLKEGLGLHGVMTEERDEATRKMIIVGLWCIQTNPLSRPSMSKVLEMLEGSVHALQIPPKPFLSSPPRSPQSQISSSTISIS